MDFNSFERLLDQLREFTPRAQITLEETPAPQRLAKFAFALCADVSSGGQADKEEELASGRFVLLHEPGGQESWEGEFRCVTFIRADLDTAMQEDPMLTEFGWNWFLAALEKANCTITAASGTVTRVSSASFGKLAPRRNESEIEIRASWTPVFSNPVELISHISAWCTLMGEIACLEELSDGVPSMASLKKR